MIELPVSPAPAAATPYMLDFGTLLRPSLGGPTQKVNRLGNRFGISVTMPPMKSPKLGRIWLSRLIQAQSEGARMRWPLQGFDAGAPGDIKVSGTGQLGSSLSVKEGEPDYYLREGQFFSILTGGRHYLYMIATEDFIGSDGSALIDKIAPMIRAAHLDNDPLFLGPPMIDGVVIGDRREWEWSIANLTGLQFEIQEME
jgi:hypothetical protein